jgi:hypothetical protein
MDGDDKADGSPPHDARKKHVTGNPTHGTSVSHLMGLECQASTETGHRPVPRLP